MIYLWFKLFNRTEFIATGLVSRTYSLNLEGLGQKDILVTQGDTLGMTYEGVFLSLRDGATRFDFDGHSMYVDVATNDVYLGIEVPNEN